MPQSTEVTPCGEVSVHPVETHLGEGTIIFRVDRFRGMVRIYIESHLPGFESSTDIYSIPAEKADALGEMLQRAGAL